MLTIPFLTSLFCVAPGSTLTATVNDPASHGTLGDARLSLDEAIRIANGTLALSSLSTLEQAQISGSGAYLHSIEIDAAITPTITLQSLLSDVTGGVATTGHIKISGLAAATLPVILGGNHSYVFAIRRHLVHIESLRIVGGQVAFDVKTGPMGPVFHMAKVHECELDGQTVAGVRVRGAGDDESMLLLLHTHFANMPTGILIDDQGTSGMCMVECEHVHMDGVGLGNDVVQNGNGDMSMINWFRSKFHNGQTLAKKRRTATSTRDFMFRFTHCDVHCTGDVIDVQGTANGLTMVHHHHSDFVAAPGAKAFYIHPRTAMFDVHGSEMTMEGDVVVMGNTFSPRCWGQNNTYKNGTVTYDVDGALPNLLWNRYENCSFVVPSAARSPVTVRSSDFNNSTVNGQSLFAPITLLGCYRSGGSVTGQATEVTPAPAQFLGTTTVSPTEPQIGAKVHLTTSLPLGIGVIWDFAFSLMRPVTTSEPIRCYGDPATLIALPVMAVFQSQIDVTLPYSAALVGLELYVQAIALPLLGQLYAPSYYLPRGSLICPHF
ncbi:MAG: hypothetical protein EXS02_13525 [Planctomycetes bacterium]|nr:hypothetical protein [Planctomycetota bacterium]